MDETRHPPWEALGEAIDREGYARIPGLLRPRECQRIAALWRDEALFRKRVDMARHGYGSGEYRYFAGPLPPAIAALRSALYPPLAAVANEWQRRTGQAGRFPEELEEFLAACAASGQSRPTPLLLRYGPGDFNTLHQDRYGDVAFPLQLVVLLSRSRVDTARDGRSADFEGGEFLLVEQRPRRQSIGAAVALSRGEALVFPNAARPVEGKRRPPQARVRHGVSRVEGGVRLALGVIFHDAL